MVPPFALQPGGGATDAGTRVVVSGMIYGCAAGETCPPNSVCVDAGVCVALGLCGAPCAPGQYCSNSGRCVAAGLCAVDEDCGFNQVCNSDRECMVRGTCRDERDCAEGMSCAAGACKPGSACGAKSFTTSSVAPNALVLLDRSGSMRTPVKSDEAATRWDVAVAAIEKVTTAFGSDIQWGLQLFPDSDGEVCAQGPLAVPFGPGREAEINRLLKAALSPADPNHATGSVTNIDAALERAASEMALTNGGGPGMILLMTDGHQSGCSTSGGAPGALSIAGDLYDKHAVRTFVVGFGNGVDVAFLGQLAQQGGTAMAMSSGFYLATDGTQLETALSSIAGRSVGCSFNLKESVANPEKIYVFFDDTVSIMRDPTHRDGWDYDLGSGVLTFYGAACSSLQSGAIKDLDIVFGCKEPIIDL